MQGHSNIVMRASAGHRDKRFIAVVMLVAWMLTLGASVANACIADGARSESLQSAHHARAESPSAPSLRAAADERGRHAPDDDGNEHAGSHQLHCQPAQAPERARVHRPAPGKSFDLDATEAVTTRLAEPVPLADRRPSLRWRSVPVVAALPLFIRFRRLIP